MAEHKLKTVLRWAVLVTALVLAAFFLNSAFFSAWNAGGPPNEYREAWAHHSLVCLAYSGAFLLGGLGLFGIIKRFPRPRFVPVALVVLAGGLALVPHGRALLAQDACLDAGGRWLQSDYRCER